MIITQTVKFPDGVVAVSDIITLIWVYGNNMVDNNNKNQIPDKSWIQQYLLEFYNKQNIPCDLNLLCSFNNDGKFVAVFNGVDQYQFKQISPIVGHSYLRQIIMNSQKRSISYILKDQNTKQIERFDLSVNPFTRAIEFVFEGQEHITGIDWWNKQGNFPYSVGYHVEISQLMYGIRDNPSDPDSVIYNPYNTLFPSSERSWKQYPVSFRKPRFKDGCICYNVVSGNCSTGLSYNEFVDG